MTCHCGADWFVEQRLVRPAGLPRPLQTHPLPVREQPKIRYVCAECGLEYGKKPQKRRTRSPKTE